MNNDIDKVIKESTFDIKEGRYAYAKLKDSPASLGGHFMVTVDSDEVTLVTREENLVKLNAVEKNKDFYTLIALNVSVPFYAVGFLATVSNAVASEGMNILIVSTYSKDYILVKAGLKDKVRDILLKLGFSEK